MDITGKLMQLLPLQSGTSARGEWKKQEFIIETEEQYPKKVCISVWGDKIPELNSCSANDTITVSINLESREFNGRWYTEARAWRIRKGAADNSISPQQSNNKVAPPTEDDFISSGDSVDDLPF